MLDRAAAFTASPSASSAVAAVGAARRMLTAVTEQEIVEAVRGCDTRGEPLLVVGAGDDPADFAPFGGADVFDAFEGTVLRIAATGVQRQRTCSGLRLGVAAGHSWDAFVAEAVDLGAAGVEALSGLPGSVGTAAVRNPGAFGQSVGASVAWIRALDRETGDIRGMQSRCLEYGPGDSVFARNPAKYVPLTVWFGFEVPAARDAERLSAPVGDAGLAAALGIAEGEQAPLALVRETVLRLRAAESR